MEWGDSTIASRNGFHAIQSCFTLRPYQHGHPCLRYPFAVEMDQSKLGKNSLLVESQQPLRTGAHRQVGPRPRSVPGNLLTLWELDSGKQLVSSNFRRRQNGRCIQQHILFCWIPKNGMSWKHNLTQHDLSRVAWVIPMIPYPNCASQSQSGTGCWPCATLGRF